MKRSLFYIVVMGILLLSACDIPIEKDSSNAMNEYTETDLAKSVDETDNSKVNGEKSGEVKGIMKDTSTENIQSDKRLSLVLYYQSEKGFLVPVTRRATKQEGIAKAAVCGLIDSSINREELEYFGLYPTLPAGTEVRGLSIKDSTATIDFNSLILDYESKAEERNIISSVVYTLTEFKTVKNVKMLVNGALKEKLKFGSDISGMLNRENVLVNTEKIHLTKGMVKSDIYFLMDSEAMLSYTLPVSVEYPETSDDAKPSKIIELLAKGPENKELYSEIPRKTRLLGSHREGKVLQLDFDKEIKSYGGGNAREKGILNQILYSMKQIDDIEKVKIIIEGKEGSLPEGTEISRGISIPAEINDYLNSKAN
ncbi:MAG: GerMN domain-containing protein [Clostridia bacterium]|nr:GerMN domain-containing protein [Clostridia bacterium]